MRYNVTELDKMLFEQSEIHYKYKLMEQLNIHQNIDGKYVDEKGNFVKFYK